MAVPIHLTSLLSILKQDKAAYLSNHQTMPQAGLELKLKFYSLEQVKPHPLFSHFDTNSWRNCDYGTTSTSSPILSDKDDSRITLSSSVQPPSHLLKVLCGRCRIKLEYWILISALVNLYYNSYTEVYQHTLHLHQCFEFLIWFYSSATLKERIIRLQNIMWKRSSAARVYCWHRMIMA